MTYCRPLVALDFQSAPSGSSELPSNKLSKTGGASPRSRFSNSTTHERMDFDHLLDPAGDLILARARSKRRSRFLMIFTGTVVFMLIVVSVRSLSGKLQAA